MLADHFDSSRAEIPTVKSFIGSSGADTTARFEHRRLFGYELLDVLGRGAGSVTYAATSPFDNQVYAVKHVVVKAGRDQRFLDQLVNEFQVGSKVRHPLL